MKKCLWAFKVKSKLKDFYIVLFASSLFYISMYDLLFQSLKMCPLVIADANQRDKRPRGRQNVHDSTLYADQQVCSLYIILMS
jgi:hypothetical protein